MMQMVKLYGMVSVSTLGSHLLLLHLLLQKVSLLKVKPSENVGDWTLLSYVQLYLVMQIDWSGIHVDLK